MQERVGTYVNHHTLPLPGDVDGMHIAHGGRGLATRRPEGAEISLTKQALRLRMHQLEIQCPSLPGELAL